MRRTRKGIRLRLQDSLWTYNLHKEVLFSHQIWKLISNLNLAQKVQISSVSTIHGYTQVKCTDFDSSFEVCTYDIDLFYLNSHDEVVIPVWQPLKWCISPFGPSWWHLNGEFYKYHQIFAIIYKCNVDVESFAMWKKCSWVLVIKIWTNSSNKISYLVEK